MPAKVLLATRLRAAPDPVARAADALADQLGAELLLLYVADELATLSQVHAATGLDPDQLRERMLDDIRATAAEFVARNLGGRTVRTLVEEGEVPECVVQAAKREAADYLVIGTEGLSPLRELIVGSTSHEILRRAPCPVLVIPPAVAR